MEDDDNLIKLNRYNRYWMVANRVFMALGMTAILAYLPMMFIGPILFEVPMWVFTGYLILAGIITIANLHSYVLGYMLQVTLTKLSDIKDEVTDQAIVDKIDVLIKLQTDDD